MFAKLTIFACLLAVACALVLKAPIHKKPSVRSRLLKEKKYEEFRLLNRIQLASHSKGGHLRMDKISQPLYDYGNQGSFEIISEYNVRLSIGTPGQTFELLPDTSTGNSWLVSKNCDSNNPYYDCPSYCNFNTNWCQLYCYKRCCSNSTDTSAHLTNSRNDEQDPCAGKRYFDPSASSTYSSNGDIFHVTVGLGNVSGVFAQDTFTLQTEPPITVTETTFGLVDRLSTSYAGTAFDGVLGLAFQSEALPGERPFFQHAVDQGIFDQPIFTIYMKLDSSSGIDQPAGSITFGGLNTDDCLSDYINVPLKSDAVWWFNVDSVQVNSNVQTPGPFVAMSSVATAINLVPFDVMYDLITETKGQYDYNTGFYEVDCTSKFTWSLLIGGQELKADQSTLLWEFAPGQCYLALGSWEDADHNIDILLGVPFLQEFCVSHDVGNGKIGFSPRK